MFKKITVHTTKRDEVIDLTPEIISFTNESAVEEGMVVIYCPHTTAGITINENADPDVAADVMRRLDELYPWNHTLDQHEEGNTAAHLKASTVGSSQQVILHKNRLLLGRWQGIQFFEFDGPRERQIFIKIVRS